MTALAPTYARYPVEFVSGSGCVLVDSDGRRVPRLPGRHLGLQHRPLPPARRRGDPGAGRAADARRATCSSPRRTCGWPSGWSSARSARSCSSPTPAPRPTRRRSSWCARRARAATSSSSTARSTAAPTARCRRRRRSPSRRRSRRWCRASRIARSPEAMRAAVDEGTAAVLIEPVQGESGVLPMGEELLRAAREACDAVGRGARVRRGPDRHGPHRDAVGVRAVRRRAGRHDGRQGARRRLADRRADHRPAAGGRARARRPRLDVRRRPAGQRRGQRGARRARRPARCSRACASSASGCASGSASCRAWRRSAAWG